MPASLELKTLNHAVDDLRAAVTSLQGKYGNLATVARLRNDLERLELDISDLGALPAAPPIRSEKDHIQLVSDEPYDPSMWADDADDEGVGGYHGANR